VTENDLALDAQSHGEGARYRPQRVTVKPGQPSRRYRNGTERLAARGMEPERGYGWLGAVIPVDARRFRVADPDLASALSEAGADLVGSSADVEIASARELRGDAALSIAVLGHPPHAERPFPVRVVRRVANSLLVRLEARRVRGAIRRLGYETVIVFVWDLHHSLHQLPIRSGRSRFSLAEYLPERALVVGRGAGQGRTLLDASLAEASQATGLALEPAPPSIRSGGLLIVDATEGILRVAVGPGAWQLRKQRAALTALRASGPPPLIAERVPWELANGRCGLADWSVERRLIGSRAKPPVSGDLLVDCVDFLVALHSLPPANAQRSTLLEQVEAVVRAVPPTEAQKVRALAERLEANLADVPRGFAHGDFFHGNLLVDGERLVGVVDWEPAGPGRLPLLDLLHLRLASGQELGDLDWGPRLARQLLPWARAGGDDVVQGYCQRVGFSLDPQRLEALVMAYWLDYVSYQLRAHEHRLAQPLWLDRSISHVLRVVDESAHM
jgi:aminoglycoside phosphotransferase (APT) family kinase protein